MAAHLNISQVEMLIKRRGQLSDHQIYEMMKSRQVFQVQTELRRDLERMKKSIQHDEKVMMASLNCQKTMFLKRVNARKRSRRYVVSLEMTTGDEKDGTDCDRAQKHDSLTEVKGGGPEDKLGGTSLKRKPTVKKGDEGSLSHRNEECQPLISTTNGNWMTKLSERNQEMTSKMTRVKDTSITPIGLVDSSQSDDVSAKPPQRNLDDAHSLDDVGQANAKLSEREKETFKVGRSLTPVYPKRRPTLNMYRSLSSFSLRIQASSIKKSVQDDACHMRKSSNQKSAPVVSKVQSINPKGPKKKHIAHSLLERPNREKTIAMLFIEREDQNGWPTVSPFDIETWLQQNRQLRGHTVIVSTNYLDESDEQIRTEDGKTSTKVKVLNLGNSQHNLKRPKHQKSLRLRLTNDRPSIRKRGRDWFMNFSAEKNKKSGLPGNQVQKETFNLMSNSPKDNISLRGRKMVLPPIGCTSSIK